MKEGQKVIVRTYSAGVFYGTLVSREGKECILKDARQIWYWAGAASLSQLAQEGTKNPEKCKFPCPVDMVLLTETIEILSTTKASQKNLEEVPVWSA